jgi:hypothetical protein
MRKLEFGMPNDSIAGFELRPPAITGSEAYGRQGLRDECGFRILK